MLKRRKRADAFSTSTTPHNHYYCSQGGIVQGEAGDRNGGLRRRSGNSLFSRKHATGVSASALEHSFDTNMSPREHTRSSPNIRDRSPGGNIDDALSMDALKAEGECQ